MIKDVQNACFTVVNPENIGLAEKFSVNPDSCDNPDFYSSYLRYTAISDLHSGKTTTHLFIDEDAQRVMGYVALRASAIISNSEDHIIGTPALEVFVLAVDKEYERRGVGSALIDYVLTLANELHENVAGLQYIILAADKKAINFYIKVHFSPIENSWDKIPKENWSASCEPMIFKLNFEKKYIVSYANADDDDDEEDIE